MGQISLGVGGGGRGRGLGAEMRVGEAIILDEAGLKEQPVSTMCPKYRLSFPGELL